MDNLMIKFLDYLTNERRYSNHTITSYQRDLTEFYTFLKTSGDDSVTSVTYQDMRFYLSYLNEKKYKSSTISRKLSSIRSFFNYLTMEEIIDTHPLDLIHYQAKNQRLPEFFYEEEMEKLFEAAYKNESTTRLRDIAIIELLYGTGLRVSELCDLKVSQINIAVQLVRVIGKGNKERIVPLGDKALEAIQAYQKNWRNQYQTEKSEHLLFISEKGDKLTPQNVRNILEEINKVAGLSVPIYPHKLRHTFATHLLNHGADMRSVQEMLGHENLSSTQIYTHVTNNQMKQAYLNAHPRAKRQTEENE